jgi:hypothetical protein
VRSDFEAETNRLHCSRGCSFFRLGECLMGQLLLFLWLCLIFVFVATGLASLVQAKTAEKPISLPELLMAIACGLPPIATFAVTVNFLLHSHPTYQFVGNDPVAVRWWSFWGDWFEAILVLSAVQILLYVVVAVLCGVVSSWRYFLIPSLFALACAVLSVLMVAMMSPSA